MRAPHLCERGQGIVEFAVIFPIFILFIFIMVDGGIVMGRYNNVNHAAKEGARLAATGADESEVRARIAAQAQGLVDASAPCDESAEESICVYYAKGPPDNEQDPGEVGSTVKVTVRYKYGLITPLASKITGGGFQIDSCAVARLERPKLDYGDSGTSIC